MTDSRRSRTVVDPARPYEQSSCPRVSDLLQPSSGITTPLPMAIYIHWLPSIVTVRQALCNRSLESRGICLQGLMRLEWLKIVLEIATRASHFHFVGVFCVSSAFTSSRRRQGRAWSCLRVVAQKVRGHKLPPQCLPWLPSCLPRSHRSGNGLQVHPD